MFIIYPPWVKCTFVHCNHRTHVCRARHFRFWFPPADDVVPLASIYFWSGIGILIASWYADQPKWRCLDVFSSTSLHYYYGYMLDGCLVSCDKRDWCLTSLLFLIRKGYYMSAFRYHWRAFDALWPRRVLLSDLFYLTGPFLFWLDLLCIFGGCSYYFTTTSRNFNASHPAI